MSLLVHTRNGRMYIHVYYIFCTAACITISRYLNYQNKFVKILPIKVIIFHLEIGNCS